LNVLVIDNLSPILEGLFISILTVFLCLAVYLFPWLSKVMFPLTKSSSTTLSMILDDPSSTPGSIVDTADIPGKSLIFKRARSNPFFVTPVLSAFSR